MAVKIKTTPRKNPQDREAPEKYYAQAIGDGRTNLKELAELVASQCTVNRADCFAVLMALEDNIIRSLRHGRIVDLGDLGSFQVGVRAKGVETPEEVAATTVKKARIIFRPGEGLRNMLKTLSYKKAQEQAA